MLSAATALVCALGVLNRSEASLPRIEIIDTPPPYVSVGTEAFVRHSTRTIYVIASTAVVRQAAGRHGECGDPDAVKKLASILVHEEWHLRNGPDEESAYQRQLIALILLGAGPGSRPYVEVQRAMFAVMSARKRGATELMVAKR